MGKAKNSGMTAAKLRTPVDSIGKQQRSKLDSRFAHVLSDSRFTSKAKVDRYGRRLQPNTEKQLLINHHGSEHRDLDKGQNKNGNEDDHVEDDQVRKELKRVSDGYDSARDDVLSDSSSEDEISDEEIEADDVRFPEKEIQDAPAGEVSSRLAVVNLDWDNIRAIDLMSVFSSFAPEGGKILKVAVYPSEFGKERIQKEELEGPPKEIFKNVSADGTQSKVGFEEELEDPEIIKKSLLKEDRGEDFDANRLRQYQLERLRYFYAVICCSSGACAEEIYHSVDGTEYLSTANFFDLRFVPDDMDFSEIPTRDEAEHVPGNYKPNDFITAALHHSKVSLTWDTDDVERKEAQKRAFTSSRANIDENDLKAYLGSDSSGEENPQGLKAQSGFSGQNSEKDVQRRRVRELLGLDKRFSNDRIRSPDAVGSMQVTFSSGLDSLTNGLVFENKPPKEETTIEAYVRKEKKRKSKRKEKSKSALEPSELKDQNEVVSFEKSEIGPVDLGFDDPFFMALEKNPGKPSNPRKRERLRGQKGKSAVGTERVSKQVDLEPLTADESQTTKKINHFNMKDIERAERRSLQKIRKGHLTIRDREALMAKENDTFEMDAEDPRFMAVYNSREFAVDPSHPRYKGTDGMKALLEESRKKRARKRERDHTAVAKKMQKTNTNDQDLFQLVEKVKNQSKA